MRKKLWGIGVCACILGMAGCDMIAPKDEKTTVYVETTQEIEVTQPEVTSPIAEGSTEDAETTLAGQTEVPVQIPTTKAPEETEDPMEYTRDNTEYRKGVEFSIYDFIYYYDNPEDHFTARLKVPLVYTKKEKLYKTINDSIIDNSEAGFRSFIELKNLEMRSYYETMTENDQYLSYYMTRELHHTDTNEGQYREYDENKSAFTIERRTGKLYTLEDVYGMDRVVQDITDGNYEVIEGLDMVFQKFTNAQIATLYSKNTTVPKDDNHQYDFYIQDDHVCVLIWVGPNYGNYVRLKLGESNLGK